MNHDLPSARGLYDPRFEHDACGVSFVVHVKGVASHRIVQTGLGALCSMEHRGATGAEVETGDGAGILLQVPDKFLRKVAGVALPPRGAYGVGIAFLPADHALAEKAKAAIVDILDDEHLVALGWREVPVDPSCLGASARKVMPSFSQLFVAARGDASGSSRDGAAGTVTGIELDRKLFVARKRIEHELP
ncbi:MAG: glutamate synthase large subunit, partial [Actinomycetota bacterium]